MLLKPIEKHGGTHVALPLALSIVNRNVAETIRKTYNTHLWHRYVSVVPLRSFKKTLRNSILCCSMYVAHGAVSLECIF